MVWLHRWMDVAALETTDGAPIELIQVGKHNHSSGPDFLEAKLRIDLTQWVGQVEIHWKSSDWYAHGHQGDPAYRNVILHVVYEHDRQVFNDDGEPIPTLELRGRIQKRLYQRYERLYTGANRLPCAEYMPKIDTIKINAWLDRVLAERWHQKTAFIRTKHRAGEADWLEAFYQIFARYIGTQYNRAPMEELASRVPLKRLTRFASNADRTALMLGVAGFLSQQTAPIGSPYQVDLTERFLFLMKKYPDLSLVEQAWKTGKVRPTNHPTRRIAQLAALSMQLPELFRTIVLGRLPNWSSIDLDMDGFWQHHYSLNTSSKRSLGMSFSSSMSDILNINVAAPFLFFYAEETGNEALKSTALAALDRIPSEHNEVTRFYDEHGLKSSSAAQSQALIQLRDHYCNHKKCVLCNIGRTIIADA